MSKLKRLSLFSSVFAVLAVISAIVYALTIGTPASIGQTNAGYAGAPKSVALDDGRVFYAWVINGQKDDATDMDVQGRIYNPDGTAATNQFQVGTWAMDGYKYDVDSMQIARLSNGNVVVGYVRSTGEPGEDTPVFNIYDPDYGILDPRFKVAIDKVAVANDVTRWESPPVFTPLREGGFVVTWMRDATGDDNVNNKLYNRIFENDGTARTGDFLVGTWAVDGTDGFDVPNFSTIQLSNGNVVLGYVRSAAETSNDEPVFQIFNPRLTPGSTGFTVASNKEMQSNDVTAYESPPVMVALPDGRFFAIWGRDGLSSGYPLWGRIFNPDGTGSTNDFEVTNIEVEGGSEWPKPP